MLYTFICFLKRLYLHRYKAIDTDIQKTSTSHMYDMFLFRLIDETQGLRAYYRTFMKHTFHYYDTIRFTTLDMIYNVFQNMKKSLASSQFDYVILMALQASVSEYTLGSSFIYKDDSFQHELRSVIHNCSELYENEKQGLTVMDFDLQNPWESSLKSENHKKVIHISAVFSMYISTAYYVKNTLQFLDCVTELHKRTRTLLTNDMYEALFVVINETHMRMKIANNSLRSALHQLHYNIPVQRLKWGFYSFVHYDICQVLTDPCSSNRMEYYKKKLDVKLHPKSIVHNIHTKSPSKSRRKNTGISHNEIVSIGIDGVSFITECIPPYLKSCVYIIKELVEYCMSFRRYTNQSIKDSHVQQFMEASCNEFENTKKLVGIFFHFIDMFLPFATAKKTYDVLTNLMSVNTEHSKVTLLILHKWKNLDVLSEHENIHMNHIFTGSVHDMAYKIIKMNLTYFEAATLEHSYYDFVK